MDPAGEKKGFENQLYPLASDRSSKCVTRVGYPKEKEELLVAGSIGEDRLTTSATHNQLFPNIKGLRTRLISKSQEFQFDLQGDGNLVLYRNRDFAPLWATGTNGQAASMLIMQDDGNLVLYGTNENALWASGTQGHPGSFVVMQDDGNLVIYETDQPIWATGTNGQF